MGTNRQAESRERPAAAAAVAADDDAISPSMVRKLWKIKVSCVVYGSERTTCPWLDNVGDSAVNRLVSDSLYLNSRTRRAAARDKCFAETI